MQSHLLIKYKKPHLIKLNNFKIGQQVQIFQFKNLDHLILKSQRSTTITFKEYEAVRRILLRKVNRLMRFTLFTKPTYILTSKPKEMRMGKGKGSFSLNFLSTRVGHCFVKFSWCHKQILPLVVYAVQTATKKTALTIKF